MSESPSPNPRADDEGKPAAEPPPPRAFAQGTGLLLQTIGALLLMTNCCVCSTAFMWDPQRPPAAAQENLADEDALSKLRNMINEPGRTGLMLTIVGSTVCGLGMMGFGLGLQSDRRRSAAGALVTCVLFMLIMIAAGVGLWTGEATFTARVWQAILAALGVMTTGFTFAAWREVRANPPPTGVDIIPPDFKIPYSVYHDDPPDVRLAKEIANRRAQLEAEQRELDQLERELEAREDDNPDTDSSP
jgi:hypothetical protein